MMREIAKSYLNYNQSDTICIPERISLTPTILRMEDISAIRVEEFSADSMYAYFHIKGMTNNDAIAVHLRVPAGVNISAYKEAISNVIFNALGNRFGIRWDEFAEDFNL